MRILFTLLVLATLAAEDDRFAWADDALAAPAAQQLALAVDATDLPGEGLLHARIALRATPGRLALRYPRWIPGTHAPSGPVQNLGGLVARGGGAVLAWERDRYDPYLFTVIVPEGVERIAIDLTYIANQPTVNSTSSDVTASAGHILINLNCCLLIPAAADIGTWTCAVTVRQPRGWQAASQLPPAGRVGDVLSHAPVTIEEAIDRPLLMGRTMTSWVLSTGDDGLRTEMHLAGAKPLRALDERWLVALRRLPAEAEALFGGARSSSYQFLVTLDVRGGLEHGCCSLCGMPSKAFADLPGSELNDRERLTHEFVHAWVGKHRRPTGMRRPDYHQEHDCDGLWIYEGLTQYLGQVLAVRCGLSEPAEWRADLMDTIAELAASPGRHWRSLRDISRSGFLLRGGSRHHPGLCRGQDYYSEGALFWLAADLTIRRDSQGRLGLDDFCRAFFGPASGPRDFTEDELIRALERLSAGDWRGRVKRWIDGTGDLDTSFLADAGWSESLPAAMGEDGLALFRPRHALAMLGLSIEHGYVTEVLTGTPAASAGIRKGDYVREVNARSVDDDPFALAHALVESTVKRAISLHVHRDGTWTNRAIAYDGGLLIPQIERIAPVPDRLAAILAPRAALAKAPVAPIP